MLMNKTLYFSFFFFFIPIFTCENTSFILKESTASTLINLGGDCQLAWQTRENGLRRYAFPFDSVVAPCDSVTQALQNKFQNFFDRENLVLVKNDEGRPLHVLDTKYNIRFIHDWGDKIPENFLEQYTTIKEIYDRRILRLLSLLDQEKSFLFMRKNIQKEEAKRLKIALELICGQKKFRLVALDTTNEIKENWNIDKIHNYYLRQPEPYEWTGDNQAWKDIFTSEGLFLGTREQSTAL